MNVVPDVSPDHQTDTPLAAYTTLRLGGPAGTLTPVSDPDEAVATVRKAAAEGRPVLVLAGGSNVVVSDDGFPGTVLLLRTRGVRQVRAYAGPSACSIRAQNSVCRMAESLRREPPSAQFRSLPE